MFCHTAGIDRKFYKGLIMVQLLTKAIRYSANITGVVAAICLFLNVSYEYVFYIPLDLSFNEMPTTLSDYIRGTINWMPTAAILYLIGTFLGIQINSASLKNKDGKTIVDGNVILTAIIKIIYGSSFSIFVMHFIFGEMLVPEGAFRSSMFFILLGLAFDIIKNFQSVTPQYKKLMITISTIFMIILSRGYNEGVNARDGKFIEYSNIFLKPNNQMFEASIVRFYDKFLLIRYKDSGQVAFLPVADLAKVVRKKKDNTRWNGMFGDWFSRKLCK